jgi:hypothetical protein
MGASADDSIAACGDAGLMDYIGATDGLLRTFQVGGSQTPRRAPSGQQMVDSLEACVCGHPPHSGRECNGGCGCTTFEPDEGRGWVRVNYIFKATSIHPQGPYPFEKAGY